MPIKPGSGSAYGLRLHLFEAEEYLNAEDQSLHALDLRFGEGQAPLPGPGFVETRLSSTWTVHVAQDASSAQCWSSPTLPVDTVVHPGLGAVAVVVALHRGGEALHAGGIFTAKGAVALLGERGAGKSTTLAYLATRHDVGVLADDQLVLREERAYAGPRSLDMRRPAVLALDLQDQTVLVRAGERHRFKPAAVPSSAPLAGLALLEWGDQVSYDLVPPRDRLALLLAHRTLPGTSVDPRLPLWLASLPMRRLVRPRGIQHLPLVARALLEQ